MWAFQSRLCCPVAPRLPPYHRTADGIHRQTYLSGSSSIGLLLQSFVDSFTRSFTHPLLHSFVLSFNRSFIGSFVHQHCPGTFPGIVERVAMPGCCSNPTPRHARELGRASSSPLQWRGFSRPLRARGCSHVLRTCRMTPTARPLLCPALRSGIHGMQRGRGPCPQQHQRSWG